MSITDCTTLTAMDVEKAHCTLLYKCSSNYGQRKDFVYFFGHLLLTLYLKFNYSLLYIFSRNGIPIAFGTMFKKKRFTVIFFTKFLMPLYYNENCFYTINNLNMHSHNIT